MKGTVWNWVKAEIFNFTVKYIYIYKHSEGLRTEQMLLETAKNEHNERRRNGSLEMWPLANSSIPHLHVSSYLSGSTVLLRAWYTNIDMHRRWFCLYAAHIFDNKIHGSAKVLSCENSKKPSLIQKNLIGSIFSSTLLTKASIFTWQSRRAGLNCAVHDHSWPQQYWGGANARSRNS